MKRKRCSFVVACKEYFGFHPGQTLSEFSNELKNLTDKDRADLTAWFPSVDYEITNSTFAA